MSYNTMNWHDQLPLLRQSHQSGPHAKMATTYNSQLSGDLVGRQHNRDKDSNQVYGAVSTSDNTLGHIYNSLSSQRVILRFSSFHEGDMAVPYMFFPLGFPLSL